MRAIVFFAVFAALAVAISAKPFVQGHENSIQAIHLTNNAIVTDSPEGDKTDSNKIHANRVAVANDPLLVLDKMAMPNLDQHGTIRSGIKPEKIGFLSYILENIHAYRGLAAERAAKLSACLALKRQRATQLSQQNNRTLSPSEQVPQQNTQSTPPLKDENKKPLTQPKHLNSFQQIPSIPMSEQHLHFREKQQTDISELFPPGLLVTPSGYPGISIPPLRIKPPNEYSLLPGLVQKNDGLTLDQEPDHLPSPSKRTYVETSGSQPEHRIKKSVRKQWIKTIGHFKAQSSLFPRIDIERIVLKTLRPHTPVVYNSDKLGEME